MRNECKLCGNNIELRLFHNSYICSNCIANLKTFINKNVVDSSLIRENSESVLDYDTYNNISVSSTNQKKKK